MQDEVTESEQVSPILRDSVRDTPSPLSHAPQARTATRQGSDDISKEQVELKLGGASSAACGGGDGNSGVAGGRVLRSAVAAKGPGWPLDLYGGSEGDGVSNIKGSCPPTWPCLAYWIATQQAEP